MAEINNFDEFKTAVKDFITAKLPDCSAELVNVTKNNGICLSGITVRQKNVNLSPTIYLEPHYDQVQSGESFADVMSDIMRSLKEGMKEAQNMKNINAISDFALAKDKIYYRLINKSANIGLLKTIPHRDFYDLAVIYNILLDSTNKGVSSVKISNDMVRHWGVDEEQLYALACKNTPALSRGKVMPMTDVMSELAKESSTLSVFNKGGEHIAADGFDITFAGKYAMPYYVATNVSGVNGASVILYDRFLETVGEKLGSFFILPSSVHECLIIPKGLRTEKEILQMVREVNETAISDETEILSDNCYFYDAKNNILQMIS